MHDQNGASTRSRVDRIDRSGRINWWRLYRFPQITPPPSSTSVANALRQASTLEQEGNFPPSNSDSSNHASTSATGTLQHFMPNHEPPTIESDTVPPPHSSVQDPLASINSMPNSTTPQILPSTVVPVIIVGLQSVDPGWRPGMPTRNDLSGQNPGENDVGEEDVVTASDNVIGVGTGEASRGRDRPRRWQSRAADAIRNLRSGRRNSGSGSTVSQTFSTPNGSRTFLIYVIGGYYPPDHSIVTGGPSNFDSFETLLFVLQFNYHRCWLIYLVHRELADLLGQVKPSTVSKDEIEKSGLEVIKSALIQEYFKEEKITANCLERVCIQRMLYHYLASFFLKKN